MHFHGCCRNIHICSSCQKAWHLEGRSSWFGHSSFTSNHGCWCGLLQFHFTANTTPSFPLFDCVIKVCVICRTMLWGLRFFRLGFPMSKANLIGTTEVSIASLAEFLMLGVAIVA